MNDRITLQQPHTGVSRPATEESESEQLSSQDNRMSKRVLWFVAWVVMNTIGFSLGEILGGRTGLLKVFSDWSGIHAGWLWVVGCLPYGFSFGFFSGLVMQPVRRNNTSPTLLQRLAWPMACAVGYTVGIGVGEKLTFAAAPSPALYGVTFGVFVGLFLGIAQAIALQGRCTSAWLWVLGCVITWVIGEATAFALGFQFRNTPIVGAVIGAASGLAMLRLCSRADVIKIKP